MDVRFLRYFLAVAQQESITKAAEIALSPEELLQLTPSWRRCKRGTS